MYSIHILGIVLIFIYYTEAQTTAVTAEKHTHDGSSSVEVIQKFANLRIGELKLIAQLSITCNL